MVKAIHRQSARRVVPDRAAVESGARIDHLRTENKKAVRDGASVSREAQKLAEELGLPTAQYRHATPDELQGLREMCAAQNSVGEKEMP